MLPDPTVRFVADISSTTPDFTIGNSFLQVAFDGATGLMTSITNTLTGVIVNVNQQLAAYVNGTGGAYILYEGQTAFPLPNPLNVTVATGPVYEEVCQTYAYDANQVCLRVYISDDPFVGNYVEVTHDLGPLEFNHELATHFTTDLVMDGATFYIDESGLEMHERVFNESLTLPGNYHALIASTYIRDNATLTSQSRQLSVITDHTMGVVSSVPGQLEVLLHRRTNFSDSQGPYPLDDTSRVNNVLLLTASTIEDCEANRPRLILQQANPVISFWSKTDYSDWSTDYRTSYTGLAADLPPNVDIMTLAVVDPENAFSQDFYFRLHHIFEAGAHPTLSLPVSIDLDSILDGVALGEATPMTLTLQTPLSDLQRRFWPTEDGRAGSTYAYAPRASANITIGPVEMPTFLYSP